MVLVRHRWHHLLKLLGLHHALLLMWRSRRHHLLLLLRLLLLNVCGTVLVVVHRQGYSLTEVRWHLH